MDPAYGRDDRCLLVLGLDSRRGHLRGHRSGAAGPASTSPPYARLGLVFSGSRGRYGRRERDPADYPSWTVGSRGRSRRLGQVLAAPGDGGDRSPHRSAALERAAGDGAGGVPASQPGRLRRADSSCAIGHHRRQRPARPGGGSRRGVGNRTDAARSGRQRQRARPRDRSQGQPPLRRSAARSPPKPSC
jgi:hypothetical protein